MPREKGLGYFGVLQRPGGGVSTELSIGVNIGGNETEIPTLVPSLTPDEVNYLLSGGRPTEAIVQKAVEHAQSRISQGLDPFAQPGEQNSMPTLQADPNDLAAMGIPVEDWPFYQVGSATGPSAPVPEAEASQVEAILNTLLDLGIPLASAIPLAVEIFTSEGAPPAAGTQAVSPAEAIASLPPGGESGGMGGPPGAEPAGFGPVGEGLRGTMKGVGFANMAANLAGYSVPGLNTVLGMYALGIGIPSAIAAKLGVPSEPNPFAGVPSLAEVQAAYDYAGVFAGDAARAARAEAEAAQNRAAAEDLTGLVNAVSPADRVGSPAGWGGNPYGAPEPSVQNPDSVFGPGGEPGPGPSPGPSPGVDVGGGYDTGGGPGPGPSGGLGGEGEGYWAGGGVADAPRGPKRAIYGEAGPESAIFVPETMFRPGVQANEEAVRRALAGSLLRMLFAVQIMRAPAGRG